MKIWELHGMHLRGAIKTTPDGDADVEGLVLSEKAYLLAVRDFRPAELIDMVRQSGPEGAARALLLHYAKDDSFQANGGRGLVAQREISWMPVLKRTDELPHAEVAGRRL